MRVRSSVPGERERLDRRRRARVLRPRRPKRAMSACRKRGRVTQGRFGTSTAPPAASTFRPRRLCQPRSSQYSRATSIISNERSNTSLRESGDHDTYSNCRVPERRLVVPRPDRLTVEGRSDLALRIVSASGTVLHDLSGTQPSWSPGGRSLAHVSGDVWVLRSRDGRRRQLNLGRYASSPAWAP